MRSEIAQIIRQDKVMELVYGNCSDPKQILGRHIIKNGQVISSYHPDAVSMRLLDEEGQIHEMEKVEQMPVYAIYFPNKNKFPYQIEMTFRDGKSYVSPDPYCFENQISPEEEEKFLAGSWERCYEKLGAHPMTIHGVQGVHFAVWAPNARRVSLIGDFNFWNGMLYPMQRHEDSGIFELFLPLIGVKSLYKYEIKTWDGEILQRIDTVATTDLEGNTNTSIVLNMNDYEWSDQIWMKDRKRKNWKEMPLAICDQQFLDSFPEHDHKKMAFTHVLLKAPGYSHGVRGKIREWIDDLHKQGIGVILQLNIGMFSPEEDGLKFYDGRSVYGYADERLSYSELRGMYRFDHSKNEVKSYLTSHLIFWMREYHVDGFLFEGVSEMVRPTYLTTGVDGKMESRVFFQQESQDFLCQITQAVKKEDYSVMVLADEKEEIVKYQEELASAQAPVDGFLNYSIPENYIEYLSTAIRHPEKKYYRLSMPLMKAGAADSILDLAFRPTLRNRLKKLDMSCLNEHEKRSWARLSMAYLMGVPGRKRWSGDRVATAEMHQYLHHLFEIYATHSCLYTAIPQKSSFMWINGMDGKNAVLSFVRRSFSKDKHLLFICNFSKKRQEAFRIGVPKYGSYRQILNSEWQEFGGTAKMDELTLEAISREWDLQPCSLRVTIPALSVQIFEF